MKYPKHNIPPNKSHLQALLNIKRVLRDKTDDFQLMSIADIIEDVDLGDED